MVIKYKQSVDNNNASGVIWCDSRFYWRSQTQRRLDLVYILSIIPNQSIVSCVDARVPHDVDNRMEALKLVGG